MSEEKNRLFLNKQYCIVSCIVLVFIALFSKFVIHLESQQEWQAVNIGGGRGVLGTILDGRNQDLSLDH